MSNHLIKHYYEEYYNSEDKEGKRQLTNMVNTILDSTTAKDMAKAVVLMMRYQMNVMDADELNPDEDQPCS